MSKGNKGTVIVTGAGGFVGKNMIKILQDEGFHVIGLDINEAEIEKCKKLGAEMYKCDLVKDDLVPIFKKGDYLIHVAALFKFKSPPELFQLLNVDLVRIVMEAAKQANFKHIIHVSSVATFGLPEKLPARELDVQNPDNLYGRTKLMGEKVAIEYMKQGLPISIVRPSLMYGEENRYGFALFFNMAAFSKYFLKSPLNLILLFPLAIVFRGGNFAHFLHVEDLCGASSFIMQRDDAIGEIYNVADDQPVNTIALFNLFMKYERVKFRWRLIPPAKLLRKNFSKLFSDPTTALLERLLKPAWALHGWHMKYKYKEIPVEISKDWLEYFTGDFIWSNKKLKKLGYKLKHPKITRGILENLIWYKKNKWLP